MSHPKPRVLFVGSMAYELPLDAALARKWNAVNERLEVRVIARGKTGDGDDGRFRLVRVPCGRLDGVSFFGALPMVLLHEWRRFRPDVVVAQSPYEAAASLPTLRLLRPRPKLVVELHGDPRTATRLYGSALRRLYAGVADAAARTGLRRADAVRAVSRYTGGIATEITGHEPTMVFPAYFDLETFLGRVSGSPARPQAAWVGALQRTKDPDLLARAWRLVAARLPEARLVVVGEGPRRGEIDSLAAEFPDTVSAVPRLAPPDVAHLLDESTLLTLTSSSEGLPRVVLEAFARGRPVVATAVGGVPDLVVPERNGLLVPSGDTEALAEALVRVLGDRPLAQRLARGASDHAERFRWTPERYARAMAELIDRVLGIADGAPRARAAL